MVVPLRNCCCETGVEYQREFKMEGEMGAEFFVMYLFFKKTKWWIEQEKM